MPIDDLWFLTKRGPDRKRMPSKRHGRGKRWRVRYVDAAGESRERLFEKKIDAETWDLSVRSGGATERPIAHADRQLVFREYGDRWRLSREAGWALETRKRVESNLRLHLYPAFGNRPVRAITVTGVLEWLTRKLNDGVPKSSLRLYFEVLDAVLAAAVADKVISDNPCNGIKLTQVLRGLSRVPKWVPTEDQVLALVDVVPNRFMAAIWLGAGQGLRIGEVFGMESGDRCAEFRRRELHVVQQLQQSGEYGGFYLAPPKSGSAGTVDLDPLVADHLAEHEREFPPVDITLTDITSGEPVVRVASFLFTSVRSRPLTYRKWSEMWATWRDAAGWPEEGTFHSLRHFFATTLITNGVDPQDVQKALRHANLRITLETYVHWLPKLDRPRGVIGTVLTKKRQERATEQDRS